MIVVQILVVGSLGNVKYSKENMHTDRVREWRLNDGKFDMDYWLNQF